MKKITSIKSLLVLIALFCAVNLGFGQAPILTFEFDGIAGTEVTFPSNYNDPAGLTNSTISRGPGLTISPSGTAGRYNARSWGTSTMALAVTNNRYMQFTITPVAGYEYNITTIVFHFQKNNDNGPKELALRSSFDSYGSNIDTIKTIPTGTIQMMITFTVNLSNLTSATTFRIYGAGAQNSSSDGGFGSTPSLGNDIIVNGTVSEIPCYFTTTWNGTTWNPSGGPNNRKAIIAGNYDTFLNGPISTCNLTVNTGATLNVANNTYVEVQNDVTVNGTLNVQTSANFVQYGNVFTGTGTVNKTTREYTNAELHYVYWSSPVASADVATVFPTPYLNRRYKYDAKSYLDQHTYGTTNGTPDGLDDDRNDWHVASGPMEVGRGYVIATAPPEEPYTPGEAYTDTAAFSGTFNTGDITVPVYRNDSELDDANWNLIGNPYPSAIDAYDFLIENFYDATLQTTGTIDGIIYLWTHNTAASAANIGNYQYSFSRDDYASMNVTGTVIGAPLDLNQATSGGEVPNGYIPSGQAFFVSYANDGVSTVDDETIYEGEVYFNNSMRTIVAGSNSQFFKNSNIKGKTAASTNKLWVNLTSDNGVFNQILVGYLNIATNNYDGVAFDAPKYLSSDAPAILYTNIPDFDTKFVIQGKAESSLNENEVIPLGFDTKIEVATLYKLSVPYVQGDFLKNNKVYLKDNLLNTIHDLSESDYTFISEVGEFTNRFEIVFKTQALSADSFDLNANTVQIIQVDDTHVTFKASSNLSIKTVTIYDLLGRQLYQLEGSNNEETYNLSNLHQSVFIAKIALSNGALITKKAIKK